MKNENIASKRSKLDFDGPRIKISQEKAIKVCSKILQQCGCHNEIAEIVSYHLTDSNLSGVESHGIMRVLQYAEQFTSGYMNPKGKASVIAIDDVFNAIDGGGSIGIPAMQLAYETALEETRQKGITCLPIRNIGHTGRHGAFAEIAAAEGLFTILIGGGNRKNWRQVAPYGGRKALMPTNPWCVGFPGGAEGPVVLDFATSKIAGGWIYAAKSAGALLPEGCIIDKDGNPSRNPEDYFEGGAILPAGEHKGYALALMGEMIAEAMLGPATTECHWLLIAIDTRRFNTSQHLTMMAEEVLEELRACPPLDGHDHVEIPGEREAKARHQANGLISIPEQTWRQILSCAENNG